MPRRSLPQPPVAGAIVNALPLRFFGRQVEPPCRLRHVLRVRLLVTAGDIQHVTDQRPTAVGDRLRQRREFRGHEFAVFPVQPEGVGVVPLRIAPAHAHDPAAVGDADAVPERAGQLTADGPFAARLLQHAYRVGPHLLAAVPRLFVGEVGTVGHDQHAGEPLLVGQRCQALPLTGDGERGTREDQEAEHQPPSKRPHTLPSVVRSPCRSMTGGSCLAPVSAGHRRKKVRNDS